MTDIEERFADNCDDGSLIERQLLSRAGVKSNCVRVQLKTVFRIAHHFGFAGYFNNDDSRFNASSILKFNMQITIGFSAFTTQRGPVGANQFSIPERSDSHAKCTLSQKFWLQ